MSKETPKVVSVQLQIAALPDMGVRALQAKHLEVTGIETASRNTVSLRRKLARLIQEKAEGGLSERAKGRVLELVPQATIRKPPKRKTKSVVESAPPVAEIAEPEIELKPKPKPQSKSSQTRPKKRQRDPRLPKAGSWVEREHDGVNHRVKVLASHFEYRRRSYPSLSKVATEIAGTRWNGFTFFGLGTKK